MTNVINRLELIRFYNKVIVLNQNRNLRIKSCRSDKNKTVDKEVKNEVKPVKKPPIKLVYKTSFVTLSNRSTVPVVETKFKFSKPSEGFSTPKFSPEIKPNKEEASQIQIPKLKLEDLLKKQLPSEKSKKGAEILEEFQKPENVEPKEKNGEKGKKLAEILQDTSKPVEDLNQPKLSKNKIEKPSKKNKLLKSTIDVSKLLSQNEPTAETIKKLLEPIAKSSKQIAR
jgi:hypothetical protein